MKGLTEENQKIAVEDGFKTAESYRERVCEKYGLTLQEMDSQRRPNSIAHPRMLAMYLIRKNTHLPLEDIGQIFGGRDHGTVIHARKRIEEAASKSAEIRNVIKEIEAEEDPSQMKFTI